MRAADPRTSGIASLADVVALERVPLEDRQLPGGIAEVLRRQAHAQPDAPALRFMMDARKPHRLERWTYAELERRVHGVARGLEALGLREDEAVSIVLPNLPEALLALWAGTLVARANPVNPLLEAEQMAVIMRAARTRVVITLGPLPGLDVHERTLQAARAAGCVRHVVMVDLASRLPPAKRLAARAAGLRRTSRAGAIATSSFEALVEENGRSDLEWSPDPDREALLFHTGGTTGAPKLARLSVGNAVAAMWSAARNRPAGALGPGTTMLCALPLFHVNAVFVGALVPWMEGGSVLLGPPQGFRDEHLLANMWGVVEAQRVTALTAVPTVYAALLEHPRAGHDISSLSFGICGAAPMPRAILDRVGREIGLDVIEAYGMTEAACASTMNPGTGERRPGSVGLRVAYQQLDVVELDAAGGYLAGCPTGRVGTVVVAGPNVFAGYADPEHERGLWVDRGDGRRWLSTGDLGRLDAAGYLWLTGRTKELIIRGGHNIDPRSIEEALEAHPDVALAAAVGRPDARVGEVPVAYVQPRHGRTPDPAALSAFAAERLHERAAVPKAVIVVETLPLTVIGKPYKPELSRREGESAIAAALAEAGLSSLVVDARHDAARGLVVRVRGAADVLAQARAVTAPYALTIESEEVT